MEIGTKITLSKMEQYVCKFIAQMRHKNNRLKGVTNAKIGNQSDWQTDLEGFGAEFAFCMGFNVFPDFSVQVRSSQRGEDAQGDAILPGGLVVDIKSTQYDDGRLLAARWKEPEVDLYALMTGVFPEYTFRGFMLQQELLQEKRLTDLGHGKGYVADQSELRPLGALFPQKGRGRGKYPPAVMDVMELFGG